MGTASYVNPGGVIAIAIIFPILTILAVSARLYSGYLRKQRIGIDGYLSLASSLFLFGCSINLLIGETHGLIGYHSHPSTSDFEIPGIVLLDKLEWSFNMMWYCGITLVKLSFLFFYRRIFRGKTFNIISWSVVGLVIAWGVTFFFVTLFQCGSHFDLNYSPLPQFLDPKCANSLIVFFANSLLSCFLDIVILIIPMPLIWQLQLRYKTKLALTGLFAIGGLCVAASALRLALYSSLWWAVKTHDLSLSILGLTGADDFGIVSLALFWSQVELGVANIACCLPAFKSLLESQAFRTLPSTISVISMRSVSRICGDRRNSMDDLPKSDEMTMFSSANRQRQISDSSWNSAQKRSKLSKDMEDPTARFDNSPFDEEQSASGNVQISISANRQSETDLYPVQGHQIKRVVTITRSST